MVYNKLNNLSMKQQTTNKQDSTKSTHAGTNGAADIAVLVNEQQQQSIETDKPKRLYQRHDAGNINARRFEVPRSFEAERLKSPMEAKAGLCDGLNVEIQIRKNAGDNNAKATVLANADDLFEGLLCLKYRELTSIERWTLDAIQEEYRHQQRGNDGQWTVLKWKNDNFNIAESDRQKNMVINVGTIARILNKGHKPQTKLVRNVRNAIDKILQLEIALPTKRGTYTKARLFVEKYRDTEYDTNTNEIVHDFNNSLIEVNDIFVLTYKDPSKQRLGYTDAVNWFLPVEVAYTIMGGTDEACFVYHYICDRYARNKGNIKKSTKNGKQTRDCIEDLNKFAARFADEKDIAKHRKRVIDGIITALHNCAKLGFIVDETITRTGSHVEWIWDTKAFAHTRLNGGELQGATSAEK